MKRPPVLPGMTSTTTPAGIGLHDRDAHRWICAKKKCQAVHHYPADKCQSCGHPKLIETKNETKKTRQT